MFTFFDAHYAMEYCLLGLSVWCFWSLKMNHFLLASVIAVIKAALGGCKEGVSGRYVIKYSDCISSGVVIFSVVIEIKVFQVFF